MKNAYQDLLTKYKSEAKRALKAARVSREHGHRDRAIRNLQAAAACTWLAIGVIRYEESYSIYGNRV